MKRIFALVLALAMAFLLIACGAQDAAPQTAPTLAPTEGPALVTNVDDFLAAIAPGAEILLGEGDFLLSSAADYGTGGSQYYTWDPLGGSDYALTIQSVEDLTIRGCGRSVTSLLTDVRQADVVKLRSCRDVTLSDMTIGHTEMAAVCEGGVVCSDRSSGITLEGLGLFGCGTTGLQATESKDITMQDCEVYDCSITGVSLSQSTGVTINGCTFHSLGKDMPVNSIFSFWSSGDVTVSNCMVTSNYAETLIYGEPTGAVTFRDNQFAGNKISQAAFSFWSEGVVMEGNVFEDNQLRSWYATYSCPALDLEGREVTFEATAEEASPLAPAEAVPVSAGEQKEVRVSTADEFIKAIASDTCIILEAETIHLSDAAGYQAAVKDFEKNTAALPTFTDPSNPSCYWENNFDGPSLVISGVSNLTIQAEGSDRKAHTLSATPRYANVLTFEQCSAVTVSGFTAGHTIEPGYCLGGVLQFRDSESLLVENCGLFGCGTMGVDAEFCQDLQVINCEIYECSVCGIQLSRCENVTIGGTLIRDIESDWGPGNHFRFYDNKNVTLDGEPLDGNYHGN